MKHFSVSYNSYMRFVNEIFHKENHFNMFVYHFQNAVHDNRHDNSLRTSWD